LIIDEKDHLYLFLPVGTAPILGSGAKGNSFTAGENKGRPMVFKKESFFW
jgi:hypothetical protein